MARTDHHRPYWVRCNDPGERRYERHHHENGVCDLGPAVSYLTKRWTHCSWEVEISPFSHVPHWYTIERWYGPERRRERDDLRGIAREYNSGHDVGESDFRNHQHRHGAAWDWS